MVVWVVWWSPILAASSIRVVGTPAGDAGAQAQVIAAAGIPLGEPLARIDASGAQQAVSALPWVESVEVRRGWPREVVIAVTPKPVVAVTTDGLAVAADGSTFPMPAGTPAGLPPVTATGPALTAAAAVVGSLPDDLRVRVRAVAAGTPDSVDLTLRSGATVHWGSADQSTEKVQVLRALLAHRAQVYDVTSPQLPTSWKS